MSPRATRTMLALGLLGVLAAPILRLAVTPLLAQAPLVPGDSGFVTHVSTGTISALFDLGSGTAVEPVAVTRTETTRGDAAAALAVVDQGLNVAVLSTLDRAVTADGRVISAVSYRMAADRHSQALADCCGAQVAGVSPSMAGAGNPLRLAWFTPEAAYPYFDIVLLTPAQMEYLGRDTVGGMAALKFQQATTPTQVGTVLVPGRLVGADADTAGAARMYSTIRTLWVDPTTGIILRRTERTLQTLRSAGGKDVLTLLAMELGTTPEQVDALVQQARREGRPVLWAHAYGPVLCLAVGGVLLVAGISSLVAGSRHRRIESEFPDEPAGFGDLRSRAEE
ncbi:MAG: porin PorA family protein [Candidatus Nanopelagicales bacterium]